MKYNTAHGMKLSEYLIEAVASRTTGKYYIPDANKQSILEWLKKKGFTGYGFDKDLEKHLRTKENAYMVGPNIKGRERSDWVSIHTKEIYEIVMWFDQRTGRISSIDLRSGDSNGDPISFLKAKRLLEKSI